ncbi:hypothetical protein RJ639_014899 [Escallonia herrerae]|uniref:Disease resistance protein winged helix domain-containing protein n=1 Tax=Escallonia herrerae TaxID=1293975 RepID=A0AA89ANX0_9ASTE|nr:hypothetical protein RJ639_014899 [Escallonia herrerae]
MELGKQITEKCKRLPLAIVGVAGLLAKKEKRQEQWKQVAEMNFRKTMISLLITLWMAKGFVKQIEDRTLEDVAESYLWI